MSFKSFEEYKLLKEADESGGTDKSGDSGGPLGAKVTLGDKNNFEPFNVSDDPKSEHYGKNKNLSPIVRAFKSGGNWGWSKDDASGDDKPVKIGGKKLYLAGGAVRDHLAGKKARNIELATSASPDEVYHLLKQNGFQFIKNDGSSSKKDDKSHQNKGSNQLFWVNQSNKNGRPFIFGLKVNEDEYELECFTKSPRGVDCDREPGTQGDDSASRDFTMNGMYILLSNDNGPNKELTDYHGGIHHMAAGKVVPIGDMEKKFKEDPKRLMRYMRFMHGYGDSKKTSVEERETIKKLGPELLKKLDAKTKMGEFKKGMDKDDSDSRKFLKLFSDFGLLDSLFPGKAVDKDLPKELSELGDKHMPIAWALRANPPEMLDDLGMDDKDMKKICFLIKSLGMNENMDGGTLMDLINGLMTSGVSGRKVREWGTKIGKIDGSLLDAFLEFSKSPRVKLYINGDDGEEKINDSFLDLVDPFTGQTDKSGIEERKKHLELDSFRKQLEYMRPV